MGDDLYNAAAIIGKTLIAQRNVPVYIIKPSQGGQQVGTIKAGNPCGVVYSYIQDTDGTLLWMFQGGAFQDYYFIPHQPGYFSTSALMQQGVITTYEAVKRAEEEKKKAGESIFDKATGTIKDIAIMAILVFAGVKLLSKSN